MTAQPGTTPEADLDLILFRVGGVNFGADAGQVASAVTLCGSEPKDCRWFHALLRYQGRPVGYRNPVVLTLHGAAPRIIVDGLEGLVRMPLADIRPLPSVLEPLARERGLWAVAKLDRALVLLVDLQQLALDELTGHPATFSS